MLTSSELENRSSKTKTFSNLLTGEERERHPDPSRETPSDTQRHDVMNSSSHSTSSELSGHFSLKPTMKSSTDRCVCVWYLYAGELLLLRKRLFDQNALDALLHGVLLRLQKGVSQSQLWYTDTHCRLFVCVWERERERERERETFCSASCWFGVSGGRPSLVVVLCPFSMLRGGPPCGQSQQVTLCDRGRV